MGRVIAYVVSGTITTGAVTPVNTANHTADPPIVIGGGAQSIIVTPAHPDDGADRYNLIAGVHRVHAARRLAYETNDALFETIDAIVLTGLDADAALLIEIDENLCRADLSLAERAQHTDKRKELPPSDSSDHDGCKWEFVTVRRDNPHEATLRAAILH